MKMWKLELCLICFLAFSGLVTSSKNNVNQNTSFAIDYENDQFLLDGKPFRYVAGSFHYFRAPRAHWRDILRKMRAAGLNAVSTYVEWSTHEPEPNHWVWDGDADLVEFIEIAREEDLLVILRPGPYICAERDFGGFPYWLLRLVPNIKLRTKDEQYLYYAERFIYEVLRRVKPLLRGNGGPIIMVQVENEYGSFYSCDDEYKRRLYETFKFGVGNDAVLFTTDGPNRNMLRCGTIPGVYGTIDFGSGANVRAKTNMMRQFTPKGPLVNSEFYPGWLTHWGEAYRRVGTAGIVKTLAEMLAQNYSVSFYMFYGGTNFAFTSGANIDQNYWPQLTSYDYDAPLTEAGDPTEKYFEIKKVISEYLPLPGLKDPIVLPKGSYGNIPMTPMLDLLSEEGRKIFGARQTNNIYQSPPTFEALALPHWLVLYEAELPSVDNPDLLSENLTLEAVPKDRALVYVDDELTGVLSRMDKIQSLTLPADSGKQLKLLVENQGHVNYGSIGVEDFKGISDVRLNNIRVQNWRVTGFLLSSISEYHMSKVAGGTTSQTGILKNGPQILAGRFVIDGVPLDTYLNTQGWGKGVAYVNGHNLGRYWPTLGPQLTLYVPAVYLKTGENSLVLVELEYVPATRSMEFQNTPVLDNLNDRIKRNNN